MPKGTEFEEKALAYLKFLFEQMGFMVTEARKQDPGTQNGFDIRIKFLDDNRKERALYFECKDYTTKISWEAISAKISQLDASAHRPDGFIAISPKVNFSNILINVLEQQQSRVQFPISYWTPSTNVKDYFSLDDGFYKWLYGAKPGNKNKTQILQTIKGLIQDMLRRKDDMEAEAKHNNKEENIHLHNNIIVNTQAPQNDEPAHDTRELTNKLPRIDTDDVVGRQAELNDLHRLLFENKKVVVVNGLGGIGKTTLAQAYLSAYYTSYRHIAWITQTSQDIINDMVSVEGLTENLAISRQGKDQKELLQEIIRGLKAVHGSPNLLIIDNTNEHLKTLKDYLPGPPYWHVLATSRGEIDGFYTRTLGFLSAPQAMDLFKKHCTRISNEDEIAELLKSVDYHTLTIEILAKVAQAQRIGPAKLQKAIQDDVKANVYIPHNAAGDKIERVRSYLSSIFNLSGLDENGQWLMKQFACLPSEYHSYDLLAELINPDEDKKEIFPDLCNGLLAQGWLLHNADVDAYKMHIVVQDVTRQQLPITIIDIEGLLHKVTACLRLDHTKDNPVDKFKWIPFGHAVLHSVGDDTSTDIALLQNSLSLRLSDLGQYEQTKELLEKVVLSFEKNLGVDHFNTAISYSNLALRLQELGQYEEAQELLQKVMISAEKNFGLDHPLTATSYSNLAIGLQKLGQHVDARELLQKAVRSDEKNFGPDHPNTAISYSNLAGVLQKLGQDEQALKLLQKAVVSSEKNFGYHHPTTALRYSKLAVALYDLQQYKDALHLAENALEILQKVLPVGHPNINTVQRVVDGIREKL